MEVTCRFKGLYLIDRELEKLQMKVCNIVQEAVIKTTPQERNAKRQNGFLRMPLQIAEKRRGSKGKEEKDTYTWGVVKRLK